MADPTDLLSTLGLTPGVALGGLGLGYEALRGNQMPKGYQQLSQAAGTLGQEGQQMMSAGLGGPLPPGAQALVNQQQNAGMANVRSTYDKLGLSGSTMEAQAQQSVNEQTMGTAFKNLAGHDDPRHESHGVERGYVQRDHAGQRRSGHCVCQGNRQFRGGACRRFGVRGRHG